jgi:DNA (cytosine-5)-methyltransferase 1
LSAEWAGFKSVGQCELADYPYKVLCKHWPDVPKWRDIRDVTAENIKNRIGGGKPISLVSAGYPCQPFSYAGKRKGERDDRHLWPEVKRVLYEVRPPWFLGENVVGHVTMGLDVVLSDLDSLNYSWQAFIIPACAVNAVHVRERVIILAHSPGTQCTSGAEIEGILRTLPENRSIIDNINGPGQAQSRENVADTTGGAERAIYQRRPGHGKDRGVCRESRGDQQRPIEPGLGGMFNGTTDRIHRPPAPLGCEQYEWEPPRVAKGIKNRRQRLECLGNMVVPWQVYPILKAIYEIERCNPVASEANRSLF